MRVEFENTFGAGLCVLPTIIYLNKTGIVIGWLFWEIAFLWD